MSSSVAFAFHVDSQRRQVRLSLLHCRVCLQRHPLAAFLHLNPGVYSSIGRMDTLPSFWSFWASPSARRFARCCFEVAQRTLPGW